MTTNSESSAMDVEEERANYIMCKSETWANLSKSNLNFLEHRISEGNLDEAIDVSRLAWDQFPRLRESADTKRTMEFLMEGLQEKMNLQVLGPVGNSMAAMTAIIDRLQDLARTNPMMIEQAFARSAEAMRTEMNNIKSAINEPTARIAELNQLINALVHKPVAIGNAGEAVLTDLWSEHFVKDQIERLGGPAREDLLIRPYLGSNGSTCYGEPISVERKAGKQRFSGSHLNEAVRHAREKGASIALLVFDNQENLPQLVKPMSISKEQGVLVVVAELQSGTWRLAREILEIMELAMNKSSKSVDDIDIQLIQQIAAELGSIVKLLEQIRGNGVKIKSCAEEVEQNAVTIKALVKSYQEKLTAAVTGKDIITQHES